MPYRALVCIYLDGGMDQFHPLIPYDLANYNAIVDYRAGINMPSRASLTPLTTLTAQPGGRQAALHPLLPTLKTLYDAGNAAIVFGVGQMTAPATRAQIESGEVKVFGGAHNGGDFRVHTFKDEGAQYGWGGLTLDRLAGMNTNHIFSSIVVGKNNNAFCNGEDTNLIKADVFGRASNIAGVSGNIFGSTVAAAQLNALMNRTSRPQPIENDYLAVNKLVGDSFSALSAAFAATTSAPAADLNNDIEMAMRTVCRLISQRATLGVERQIFFINMRNFDQHSGIDTDLHSNMQRLDAAIAYFNARMVEQGLTNDVTLFTTTEFGRALRSNGNGTDHGWGGLAFVVGGAVRGGDIYGTLAEINHNGPHFAFTAGTLVSLPTISNQQYCATMSKWMGLTDRQLEEVFPDLNLFSPTTLNLFE